ncbi:MAG TPA: hypothetical protein DIW23_07315 [Anaerolineae bacterium]|nr:hypothetical protein [Anaerolineae bacterium]HCR71233.1 hypothetical protein [Anaerolineae bacterium]
MDEIQIKLSGLWVATMLIYLLGDVLRLFSGDTKPGEMAGQVVSKNMYLIAAVLMLIPILMVLFSLFLDYPANRWSNIIVAGFFLLFNLIGLPGYPSLYDKFLLAVSLVFNGMTIWLAWNWVQ